jgi:pantoate--beta-alanine ligase
MKVISTRHELEIEIESMRNAGLEIGFVPTMGALHQGHLSLIEASKKDNLFTVSSIFVNPLQFNNPQDLEKYPRYLEDDLLMLSSSGCNLVFTPDVNEMYPEPIIKEYEFDWLDKVMEGSSRPGHFNGVAIVVEQLFRMVRPHRAYFGEKDYQQLMIVKRLVEICDLDIEIVPCPIIRESDGLAMSSRNRRLSPEQRQEASLIYTVLSEMNSMAPEHSPEHIKEHALQRLRKNPFFEPEYVEICREDNLEPILRWEKGLRARAFIAASMGQVRLIDNMPILCNFAGYAN